MRWIELRNANVAVSILRVKGSQIYAAEAFPRAEDTGGFISFIWPNTSGLSPILCSTQTCLSKDTVNT